MAQSHSFFKFSGSVKYDEIILKDNVDEKSKPQAILAFDIDDTLIDFKDSLKQKKVSYLYKDRMVSLLQQAKKNNVMIIAITSRPYVIEGGIQEEGMGASAVIRGLGDGFFQRIIFSSQKASVLKILQTTYKLPQDSICLVDDQLGFLMQARGLGFVGYQARLNDEEHLNDVDKFIRNISQNAKVDDPGYESDEPDPC